MLLTTYWDGAPLVRLKLADDLRIEREVDDRRERLGQSAAFFRIPERFGPSQGTDGVGVIECEQRHVGLQAERVDAG